MASTTKSLEEMLTSDVDQSAFNALVGTLETQLDPQITNQLNPTTNNSSQMTNRLNKTVTELNCANSTLLNNCSPANQSPSTNNNGDSSSNNLTNNLVNSNSTVLPPQTNVNSNSNSSDAISKRIINNAINSSDINNSSNAASSMTTTTSSTTSNTNILSSNLPGALPASGYINQVTNSPSTLVSSAIPTNQILQNAIKVSPMSNGNGSSTVNQQQQQQPQQQQPQQQQQTVAQQLTTQSTPVPIPALTSTATHRPATPITLSAMQPQLLIAQNKNVSGAKPGQTVYIATTKDVGQFIVQSTNSNTNANQGTTNDVSNSNRSTSGQPTSAVFTIATTKPTVTNVNSSTPTAAVIAGAAANTPGQPGAAGQPSGTQNQIVHHVVPNTSQPILQLVTNLNPSRPAGNANIQPQKTLAPRVVQLPTNLRLTAQQVIRPGAVPGTITLPSNLLTRPGTIFVKGENGQVHMVNVGAQLPPGQPGQPTYRIQVPTTTQSGVRTMGPQQLVLPVSAMTNALQNRMPTQQQSHPLTIQTTTANAQAAATPSQMSPNTAKKKCKNFLSTLIRLASDQPEQVATNVKNLIQSLIDDAIQPEKFTDQLQKELNSSPQPQLVPFLKKSLPYLRYSLSQNEFTIEGVRPPPQGAVTLPPPQSIPQIQISQQAKTPQVRVLGSIPGGFIGTQTILTPITQSTQRLPTPQLANKTFSQPTISTPKTAVKSSNKSRSPATSKDRKQFSSSLKDDDDINDVTAMGGINLVEESQRILASNSEMVGQQIRSCKDETFLYSTPLNTRINKIAMKFGLEEASSDVVAIVSHAVQERLKTLVEKLGMIAEHRQEQLKNDPKYEITQDVKAQVQFLQELDRVEKRKHEEQEREVLMRAAKSRSKAEDPEQLRLKQRAKELQRQEMEELRQKEANETALQAIGNPRKKLKVGLNSSVNMSSSILNNSLNSSHFGLSSKPLKRVKRVCMRDLHFLMENDKETVRSVTLYKAYAK